MQSSKAAHRCPWALSQPPTAVAPTHRGHAQRARTCVPGCRNTRVGTDGGHVHALVARWGVDNNRAAANRGLPLPLSSLGSFAASLGAKLCVRLCLQASDFGVVLQWLERLLNAHPADVVVLSRVGCVLLQVRAEYAVP